MPNPVFQSVHLDVPLTNLSIAYAQDAEQFIADKVFPMVPVEKQSDKYFTYDKGDLLRIEAKIRAPGTESEGGGYRVSSDRYSCERYALHKDIDDPTRKNSDSMLDPDADATEYLTQNLLMLRDQLWADRFFQAGGVWSTDYAGVAAAPGAGQFLRWSVPGSTPVQDIRRGRRDINGLTGYWPNKLVLGRTVFDTLLDHADLIDRIKYTTKATGQSVEDIMAELFQVEEVLIADAIRNTGVEGQAFVGTRIFGAGALLAYAAPAPSLRRPSAGYTFSWSEFDLVKRGGAAMKKFRMEQIESDRVEGQMSFDFKVTGQDLGAFFATAV